MASEGFVVPAVGRVVELQTGPFWSVEGPGGSRLDPVERFLTDFWVRGMSPSSVESYARALLRWFRFLWATDSGWERASRDDVRDFVLWMKSTPKAGRQAAAGSVPNAVTGKRGPGAFFASRTINHNLSVVAAFYEFHIHRFEGPVVNPVPARQGPDGGRFAAHHNPLDPFPSAPRAGYRQKEPKQEPRSLPDSAVADVFALLSSDRDRALFSFWLSSAARPSELIGMRQSMVDPGQQLITVIRKGTRALQAIPAAAEDFVWFRLYQESLPVQLRGPELPAWWTLRRPFRPLDYDAARAIFRRLNEALGSNWTLHDLRHTAAMRMAEDRRVSLTDIQRILGHSSVSTTQEYLRSRDEDVFARVRQHLRNPRPQLPATAAIPEGYADGDLRELFGGQGW